MGTLSSALYLNSTNEDKRSRDAVHELKVFNISMLSLSVCVLTVTAIACCASYVNRCRHRKRACEYERVVSCDHKEEPVNLKVMKRSERLRNSLPLFRPRESPGKDGSSVSYVYNNPRSVGCHDNDADTMYTQTTLALNDPEDGIILKPHTFYMQL